MKELEATFIKDYQKLDELLKEIIKVNYYLIINNKQNEY